MPMSRLFSQALAAATISLSAWTMRTPTLEVHAFAAPRVVRASMTPRTPPSRRFAEASSPASPDSEVLSSPQDMRLREIQSELKERKVSYSDCFDRESLVKRLTEAREGSILPSVDESSGPAEATSSEAEHETTDTSPAEATTTKPAVEGGKGEEFDRESTLAELRSLRVKELKVKLSELKVRWGTMIEKEDMVQALCGAMEERFEQSKNFSRSGELTPGTVRDVDESVLIKELGWSESDINRGVATAAVEADTSGGDPNPPILLDVYATWCGPCQFLAPLLVEAAEELGPTARVVKIDSDKYPRICSTLKVGGLPTLIRFDGGMVSKEVQRVEGALTKDQILAFVNGDFNM